MAIADDTLDRIEGEDLSGLGRSDIDDVIEYVHVPTARLPGYRKLYDRYLRQRWNVNDLDFTEDRVNWTERMTDDARNSFLSIASGFHHGERQVEVELASLRTKPGTPCSSTVSTATLSGWTATASWTFSTGSGPTSRRRSSGRSACSRT